jgi:hypothetical protein
MRSLVASSVPLWVTQMFVSDRAFLSRSRPLIVSMQHNMGFQYAGLLLALIACVISPIPFLFFFKGEAVRKRSSRATK